MATLELTDDQVLELVRQLPPSRQRALLESLVRTHWNAWAELSTAAAPAARAAAAARGRDWDNMTEAAREAFVDELVHEDRLQAGID